MIRNCADRNFLFRHVPPVDLSLSPSIFTRDWYSPSFCSITIVYWTSHPMQWTAWITHNIARWWSTCGQTVNMLWRSCGRGGLKTHRRVPGNFMNNLWSWRNFILISSQVSASNRIHLLFKWEKALLPPPSSQNAIYLATTLSGVFWKLLPLSTTDGKVIKVVNSDSMRLIHFRVLLSGCLLTLIFW